MWQVRDVVGTRPTPTGQEYLAAKIGPLIQGLLPVPRQP
jgi:hypothetical protein